MYEQPAAARLVEAFANTIDVELDTDDLGTPEQLTAWLAGQELLTPPPRATADDHALALRLRAGLRERLGVPVGDQPAADLLAGADQALRALPLLATVDGAEPAPTAGAPTADTTRRPQDRAAGPAPQGPAPSAAAPVPPRAAGPTHPEPGRTAGAEPSDPPRLRAAGGAFLVPGPGLPPVRRGLAAVAIAWSELLITGEAARLKRCAEHGCAWVFWDVSKNRSRRWCSMRVCGNRNKARRFAAKRSATAPPQRPAH